MSRDIIDMEKDVFSELMLVSTLRGHQGAGVLTVDAKGKQPINIAKYAGSGAAFVSTPKYVEAVYKRKLSVIVGHCRAPTKGDEDIKNIHPHIAGTIAGVHNGTMFNVDGKYIDKDTSDSAILYDAISKRGVNEVVKDSSGAYCLVWADNQNSKMHFLRNSERPLWFAGDVLDNPSTLYWASEADFLRLILGRKGRKFVYWQLPPNKLVTYDMQPTGLLRSEVRDCEKPFPVYISYNEQGWVTEDNGFQEWRKLTELEKQSGRTFEQYSADKDRKRSPLRERVEQHRKDIADKRAKEAREAEALYELGYEPGEAGQDCLPDIGVGGSCAFPGQQRGTGINSSGATQDNGPASNASNVSASGGTVGTALVPVASSTGQGTIGSVGKVVHYKRYKDAESIVAQDEIKAYAHGIIRELEEIINARPTVSDLKRQAQSFTENRTRYMAGPKLSKAERKRQRRHGRMGHNSGHMTYKETFPRHFISPKDLEELLAKGKCENCNDHSNMQEYDSGGVVFLTRDGKFLCEQCSGMEDVVQNVKGIYPHAFPKDTTDPMEDADNTEALNDQLPDFLTGSGRPSVH